MSLGQQLHTLESAELIRLAAVDPELAYLFRHALVREAAYGSLVKADRRRLHLAAAEAMEAMDAPAGRPVTPEVAALLAQHYHQAGEARTQHYAALAGEAAMARYANAEAVSHFTLALDWAQRGDPAEPLGPLYMARGRALELIGKYAEAFENYQALEAAGQARGDQRLVLQGLVLQGKLCSTPNPMFNPAEGIRLAAVALPLAQSLDDREAQAKIHWNGLNLNRFTGNMRAARVSGEQSLALARAVGRRRARNRHPQRPDPCLWRARGLAGTPGRGGGSNRTLAGAGQLADAGRQPVHDLVLRGHARRL